MTESLGIQSRPPQLAELEEGQSVTVLAQPKTLGGGAPLASQYREYKRVGGKLLSWEAKDMLADVDWSTTLPDSLAITNIPAGESDYDKFLVSDGGMIKYRTGAQMLSDLGVATADHTHELSDLTDLVITGPADLDVLQYNGASWVDLSLAEAGISATGHLHDDRYYTETEIDAMPLVDYTGTPANNQIAIFTDVDTIEGDANLTWTGSVLGLIVDTEPGITIQSSSIAPTIRWMDGSDSDYFQWRMNRANDYFILQSNTTDILTALKGGYVGIGTASPGTALELQSSSPVLRLRDTGATANATTAYVEFGGTDAAAWSRTGFVGDAASANTDIYLQAEISDLHLGDSSSANVLNLQGGNVGIGLTTVDANYKLIIRRVADVNLGIGLQSSELALAAFNDALSANIPMRFYASEFNFLNGSFGIGTAAPTSLLHVSGASAAVRADATSGNPTYRLSESGVTRGTLRYDVTSHYVELAASGENADVVLIPNGTGGVGVGTTAVPYLWTLKNEGQMGDVSFSSGWAGNDWALTYAAGLATLQIDDLFVRGSLTVYELIINQINAVNGAMIISPARGKVASVSGSPSTEVVTMEDPEGNGYTTFAEDDIVLIQRVDLNAAYTIVKRIVRKVASAAGAAVTMSAAAGAPADTGSIAAGDVVVVIGNVNTTTRDASIYMTSTDSNNPYIQVMDGVTSWADWTDVGKIKCVLGNLNGKYGYASELYGLAAGDYTAAAGKQYFSIDPTNGLRIMQYQGSWKTMLVASADLLQVGETADKFKYVPSTNVLTVAGWTVNVNFIQYLYEADHQLVISSDAKSIYFYDTTPEAGDVRWLGMGKLYDGSDWLADEGIGMVVYNGATYDKMFWLSQNEKSIAGWQLTKDTLEKLTANVGVKLDAANAKIQVGNLDEQHIDLLGSSGDFFFYERTGVDTSRLSIQITNDILGAGFPGVSVAEGGYTIHNYGSLVKLAQLLAGGAGPNSDQNSGEMILHIGTAPFARFFDIYNVSGASRLFISSLESATGTDLVIDAGGFVKKKSSSRRYKKNIRPLEIDSSLIYKAPLSTFEWRTNNLTDHGLIAEDLSDLHQDLAFYNSDGKAESVNQGALMALTIAELKKLRTDVDKLIAVQEAN